MSLAIGVESSGELLMSVPADETFFVHEEEYREGDVLVLSSSNAPCHVILQFDETLQPSLVYLAGDEFRFSVPFAEKRVCYSPRAFAGKRHLLTARYASSEEIGLRRNLALNPHDIHGDTTAYPHASANVETRGESVFAARNAIDGLKANTFHGEWPFTSWGINRDPAARLTVSFGRAVSVNRAVLYLRADFPHDAWWSSATLRFSDGSSLIVSLEKHGGAQSFEFPSKTIDWVSLDTLVKADDPSPFPALTQIEVYGTM